MAPLIVVADAEALADAAAEQLTRSIAAAIAERGSAFVALTGGRSAGRTYQRLASPSRPFRSRISWPRVHVLWSDERLVPAEHPDSNFGLAQRDLLMHVPIDPSHVHRIPGEFSAAAAASRAESDLRQAFAAAGRTAAAPDVMLLSIGDDAHIASIFPGSELLADSMADDGAIAGATDPHARGSQPGLLAAIWAPHLRAWRVTLTPATVLSSNALVLYATGEAKAHAVRAALVMPLEPRRYPAQILRSAADRSTWILDRAAAALLPDAPRA